MLALDALVDLVAALRDKGYDVGTQECLAANRLLLALEARAGLPASEAELATLLAPVFCSSMLEQEAFYRDFRAWLARRRPVAGQGDAVAAGQAAAAALPERAAPPPVRRAGLKAGLEAGLDALLKRPQRLAAVLTAVLAAIVGAVALAWYLLAPRQGEIRLEGGARPVLSSSCRACTLRPGADGRFTLQYRRLDLPIDLQASAAGRCPAARRLDRDSRFPVTVTLEPEPCSAVAPPPPPAGALPTVLAQAAAVLPARPDRARQAGAALLPLIAAAVLLLLAGWRRRLALHSAERAEPPTLQRLRLAGNSFVLFDRATLRRIAQEFRRHRPRSTLELDAGATVAATVAAGGLFTPVPLSRKALPEYLVLIDRAGVRDHQARWAEELVDQLVLGGVVVDRYYFNRDPRNCQIDFQRPSNIRLADLLALHHEHVLMVFGSGEGLFDPLSGEPCAWLEAFAGWGRRVLVTPLPMSRWSYREAALRELGFVIAPADLGGMQMIASMAEVFRDTGAPERPFPALLRDGDTRWLERSAPEDSEQLRLLGQLKWFLGPAGFRWLGACALYPQLQWDITLHLGLRLLRDEAAVRVLLASLCQLPWFRAGAMPWWLRQRLAAGLAPAEEHEARRAFAEILAGEGVGGAGFVLELASEARVAKQALRSHPESPLRDYAFVSFMRGKRLSALEVDVPESWRRLFERRWLPSPGLATAAVAAALLLSAGTWRAAGDLFTQPQGFEGVYLSGSLVFAKAQGTGLDIWQVGQDGRLARTTTRAVLGSPDNLIVDAATSPQAAVSADGRLVAQADANGEVTLRDVRNPGAVRSVPIPLALRQPGRTVPALSPDGRWLAVGGTPDGRVRVFDTVSLEARPDIPPFVGQAAATALAFSDDGARLAIGTADGSLLQSGLSGGPELIGSTGAALTRLVWADEGRLLASGDRAGAVRLWSMASRTGTELGAGARLGPVSGLALRSDLTRLAATSEHGELVVWELAPPDRGADTPVVDPSVVRFEPTPVGGQSLASVRITNPSRARRGIGAFALDAGAPFGLTGRGCGPEVSLSPGASCVAELRFVPRAVGRVETQLTIAYEGVPGRIAVTLQGEGLPAASVLSARLSARPATIEAGQAARLCYTLAAASAASISPGVGEVRPVSGSCVEVRPPQSTAYRLTVRDAEGRTVQASAQVTVNPATPPPRIVSFTANPARASEGDPVQLCWGVENGERVSIAEAGVTDRALPTARSTRAGMVSSDCVTVTASPRTGRYTLVASAGKAAPATASLTLPVTPKAELIDEVQVIASTPSPGGLVVVQLGRPLRLDYDIVYTLQTRERARLVVSLGLTPSGSGCDSRGGLLVSAGEATVERGQGKVRITVTWTPGEGKEEAYPEGSLAPVPSWWEPGSNVRLQLLPADRRYCMRYQLRSTAPVQKTPAAPSTAPAPPSGLTVK